LQLDNIIRPHNPAQTRRLDSYLKRSLDEFFNRRVKYPAEGRALYQMLWANTRNHVQKLLPRPD
ncbi:MAG: hypothetical protein MI976_23880, partial [Pseudomonadales bacterium]|nr:hypothetical protein [Pseudomonadales bacterium]